METTEPWSGTELKQCSQNEFKLRYLWPCNLWLRNTDPTEKLGEK